MSHVHLCACGAPVECTAEYERNFDGWPDPVCRAVVAGADFTCAACDEHGQCDECGAATIDPANGLRCTKCESEREPPEPDLSGPTYREQSDHELYELMRERRRW